MAVALDHFVIQTIEFLEGLEGKFTWSVCKVNVSAQGIRRVIAVTGQEAEDATKLAQQLETRLQELDKQSGPSLEADLTAYKMVRLFIKQHVMQS